MKSRETVLIVDDSVESLNFLTDALEDAGFTVLVALNGLTAMTLVDRVAPDIVLMDAVMPGLDGFETCRRLKASASYIDLPVIFMTGLSETEDIIRGFEAGGVDYVTKPVVPDELLPRIQRHLATAQSVRSARTALDLTGRFLIAVDSSGRTVWSTPQATRLLKEIFNQEDAGTFTVPAELAGCLNPTPNGPAPRAKMQVGNRSLEIVYVGRVSDGEILLRLALAEAEADKSALRRAFTLTDRETDVLLWIAAGKSNRDIADILGLSPRTVNKYLDQIYLKISVENRASAAAKAVRVLSAL
jgi:DNA-binding response OmpR family regulator/DNA-binding CsgD family transcriptional regulator